MSLRYYVVLAQWDGQTCHECPGDNGRDWMVVRARDVQAALEIAERDQPEPGDEEIVYYTFELAQLPPSQARISKPMDPDVICDGIAVQTPPPYRGDDV